jgi:carbonic anhydrase
MQKLIQGLHKFQSEVFSAQRSFFERLADGQQPETLFITCADSRINPNLLTQTGPGELFILRNAGNIIPPYGANNGGAGGESATIEYAVQVLGVKDIIVCGHSHCGAMAALLTNGDGARDLPAVQQWLGHAETTRRIIRENYRHLEGKALLTAAIEENVLVQLESLRTHPSVRAKLAARQVRLHGWVYKIETGEVFAYNPTSGQFERLGDAPLAEPQRETPRPLI